MLYQFGWLHDLLWFMKEVEVILVESSFKIKQRNCERLASYGLSSVHVYNTIKI